MVGTTLAHTTDAARLARWIRVGWWCTALSLVWNVAEGVIAVWAGEIADSVALVGFGIDSFIETASAGVIAWRLWTARLNARADPAAALLLVRSTVREARSAWRGEACGCAACARPPPRHPRHPMHARRRRREHAGGTT